MKLLSRAVLLLLAASAFAACGPKRIGDTDIVDSADARAVLGVVDDYRKAAERRDADAVLALVSPQYFDDAGTSDPMDDVDYAQLKKKLPEDYQKLAAVKLDFKVRQVNVTGDQAAAELLYDGHYRVITPKGEVPKQVTDVQRMMFHREGGRWKITSGL